MIPKVFPAQSSKCDVKKLSKLCSSFAAERPFVSWHMEEGAQTWGILLMSHLAQRLHRFVGARKLFFILQHSFPAMTNRPSVESFLPAEP